VITSPPYYQLRKYEAPDLAYGGEAGCEHTWVDDGTCADCGAWIGQLGWEPTSDLYIEHLVEIFRETFRVLRSDGIFWLNIGDSFCKKTHGDYRKGNLLCVPSRVVQEMMKEGWTHKCDCVWEKPNVFPESVHDAHYKVVGKCESCEDGACGECWKGKILKRKNGSGRPNRIHEYLYLLTKGEDSYFYDMEGNREPYSEASRKRIEYPLSGGAKVRAGSQGRGWAAGSEDRSDASQFAKRGKNIRSVWRIGLQNYPGQHYAVFPPNLVRRCLKLGTSDGGCCGGCGRPFFRVLEEDHPVGWVQDCNCKVEGEAAPCRVLDMFGGSGTVGKVAAEIGREAVLVEIGDDYASQAEERVNEELGLLTEVKVESADEFSLEA